MTKFANGDHLTLEKDGLYYTIHQAMMVNELNHSYGAYTLQNAQKANSGPSFGPIQYDIGSNTKGRTLLEAIAQNARSTDKLIMNEEQITLIRTHLYQPFNRMGTEDKRVYDQLKPFIERVLSSSYGKETIAQDYFSVIEGYIKQLKHIINQYTNNEAKTFVANDLTLQTELIDTLNQYGSVGSESLRFLNNTQNSEPIRGIMVKGDYGTAEDYHAFKLQWVYGKTNPVDVNRRYRAIVEICKGEKRNIYSYGESNNSDDTSGITLNKSESKQSLFSRITSFFSRLWKNE